MTLLEQLQQFIEESQKRPGSHNAWLKDKVTQVYVRKGFHCVDGTLQTCLDIANVEVKSKHRGKGIFTKFLVNAQKMNPWNIIYAENVQPRLAARLERDGWKRDIIVNCYYKMNHDGERT